MKIAICTATFSHFSGIDRVVVLQARRLMQEGHSVTIVCLDGDMECPGAQIIRLGLPSGLLAQRVLRLFYFIKRAQIHDAVKKIKDCEIVYAHQYPMTLIASQAARHHGIKFVYYNHGVPPAATFETLLEKIYITIFAWFTKISIRSASEVISISNYLGSVLKRETGKESRVVYNDIDHDRFHPNVNGDAIRAQYRLSDALVILYVGRLSPHKGVRELIEIFHRVREKIPNSYLLIVGKQTFDTYYNALKTIADDHVIFCGFVPDEQLPLYYAACTVYATASHWEGFDLPVAEAQAMGKPVVAYDVGPHRELINDTLNLITESDVEQFARRLIAMIQP